MSVLVVGVACGYDSPLAIVGAAARWDQEVLAAHGCRRSPVTGLFVAPSASTLGRLPALLDADELEGALSAWTAPAALDPQVVVQARARTVAGGDGRKRRRRKPPFLFVGAPLNVRGATGAPIRPLAVTGS